MVRPAKYDTDELGREVLRLRAKRVPWKIIEKIYGLTRAWLHRCTRRFLATNQSDNDTTS